jgi:hypothetical protein
MKKIIGRRGPHGSHQGGVLPRHKFPELGRAFARKSVAGRTFGFARLFRLTGRMAVILSS